MICPRKVRCAACVKYEAKVAQPQIQEIAPATSIDPELLHLRTLLNESHDPLHRIPREIASHIFETFFEEHLGPKEKPFMLGAVCRLWRDISWATPKLWTSAHFILDPNNSEWASQVRLFEEYVGRSGSLPIDIYINWREGHGLPPGDLEMHHVVDILKGCVSRWSSLELYLHHYAFPSLLKDLPYIPRPTLRHLRLFPIGDEEDGFDDSFDEEDEEGGHENPRPLNWTSITSNLETLELDAYCDVVILDDLKVDCSSLTRIAGRGTYDAISTYIRTSPRLTTASIEPGTGSSSGHTEAPFIHESLRHLELSPSDTNELLTSFIFPHLNSFSLVASNLPFFRPEVVAAFLAKSGEHLRRLHLARSMWSIEDLQRALIPLPHLEELFFDHEVTVSIPQLITFLFGGSNTDPMDGGKPHIPTPRFPELQVLKILDIYLREADLWDCLQLVEQYCNRSAIETSPPEFGQDGKSGSARLRLLEIKFSTHSQSPYLHQNHLEIVERLGGMGVRVDISWYHQAGIEDLIGASSWRLAQHSIEDSDCC